jgi:hypothetical protein
MIKKEFILKDIRKEEMVERNVNPMNLKVYISIQMMATSI